MTEPDTSFRIFGNQKLTPIVLSDIPDRNADDIKKELNIGLRRAFGVFPIYETAAQTAVNADRTEILVAGPNFGCGSSREHAVWGLMQFGIRAVVAAGFGEIFYSNCFNNGLLAAKVTPEDAAQLLSVLSDAVPVSLTIDLPAQTLSAAGGLTVPFLSLIHI